MKCDLPWLVDETGNSVEQIILINCIPVQSQSEAFADRSVYISSLIISKRYS